MNTKIKYLILGAGMAGLGAGIALNRQGKGGETLILEAEYKIGGLNSTTQVAGCDFDMGPKILLLDESENSQEILSFLGTNVEKLPVVEKVYLKALDKLFNFPLQRHLVELPEGLRQAYLESFRQAQQSPREVKNFKDWLINGFGEVFCRTILIPYEEKKWQQSLDDMDYQWALDRPIKVDAAEVERGAIEHLPPSRHYYYPKHGNISLVTTEMAKYAGPIVLGAKVIRINSDTQKVWTMNGHVYEYEYLISTLPLDTFTAIDAGQTDKEELRQKYLKRLSVKIYNLVFMGDHELPGTAIYFPDEDIIFRRLSVLKNICPALHRPGFTTVSAEVSVNLNHAFDDEKILTKVLEDLYAIKLFAKLKPHYHTISVLNVDFAYPLQLNGLTEAVKTLHSQYEAKQVYHCGRGGSYNYCNSDIAYKQGKETILKF